VIETQPQLTPIKQRLLEKLLKSEAQRQVREAPIEPRPRDLRVPLAPGQHQIWLHAQLDPQAPIYNAPVTLHFHGALDCDALQRALDEMIQRHEIWRTTFAYVDGQVVQAIHDRLPIEIPFHDLTALAPEISEAEAIRLATADAHRPFDLAVGPLMRARLVKLAAGEFRLFLVLHHLIHDGVTVYGVLMSELPAIYDAFSKGQPSPLPLPRLQFADFALWQKRFLDNGSASGQAAFWRKQLEGELRPLQLPTDRPRPAVFSFRGAAADFTIPARLAKAIRETARAEGVTAFSLMLSGLKALLYRYTGQVDVPIGTFTDTRPRAEFERMAGFLMNTVVLRSRPSAERKFREYLREVQRIVMDALANRDVPLDWVARELRWPRDASRHPIFDISFTLVPALGIQDSRWKRTESEVSAGAAKWDLDFQVDERDEAYAVRVTYCTDLYDRATVDQLFAHWLTLLEGAIENPESRLIDLPLLSRDEIYDICIRRNETRRTTIPKTVPTLFEEQVVRTPNAIALEYGDATLTYAELNRAANGLAWRLREHGAKPGTLVALSVDRSVQMVIAVLAVLKTGAAYLPLDPGLPEERQQFILQDSEAEFLLTGTPDANERASHVPAGIKIVSCETSRRTENLSHSGPGDDVAHVLYTSGSTGKPKGVQVPHRALTNFLQSMRRTPGFTEADKLLAVTTLSFDIAGLELYLPLICGGRVILAGSQEARDPILLRDLMARTEPTVMQATPATWRGLLDVGWEGARGLKILCGGESLTRDLADQLLARSAEVWNMYGPTETTIWSTIHRVMPVETPVPIGRPIDNTQIYVLDSERRPVPDGVTGELYIGGEGLALGYLRRPELTAEKFAPIEAAGGARLYRTGDLARWRQDQTVECLGRADNQVKIRGFRVEVEEIEAVLALHPEVRAAAVKAWPDRSGHLALTGYVVANRDLDLRAFLRQKLPDHMVPSHFVRLPQLPMTPNLKVDRRQLAQPEVGRDRTHFVASEGEDERKLATIWESILDIQNISVDEDFFSAGGHSLLIPKLLARVEQSFGVLLPMAALFEAPTVREFARRLKTGTLPSYRNGRTVSISKEDSKRPLMWLYPGSEMRAVIQHMRRSITGVALSPRDEAGLPKNFTLEQIAAPLAREIRKMQPEGPYTLGGWCSSGILAYEVACQLRQQGGEVSAVVLLDSLNPVKYFATPAHRRRASKIKYHLKRLAALRADRVGDYLRERADWARRRFRQQTGAYEEIFAKAIERYVPPAYSGRVICVIPERIPSYRDPQFHWKDVVTDLQIRVVPGDHVSMFAEGSAELAAAITSALTTQEPRVERRAPGKVMRFAGSNAV